LFDKILVLPLTYLFTFIFYKMKTFFKELLIKILSRAHEYYPSTQEEYFQSKRHKEFYTNFELKIPHYVDNQDPLLHQLITIILAHSFCSSIFDRLKVITMEYPFQSIIGGQIKENKFYPTFQTISFILIGNDFHRKRHLIDNYFSEDSYLIKNKIIQPLINNLYINDCIIEFTNSFINDVFNLNNFKKNNFIPENIPISIYSTTEKWDDLFLNEREIQELDEVKKWLNHYNKLNSTSLFKNFNVGYKAVLYGASGTGKTVSVGILGNECQVPVYRIDLSLIISKWVGETEKNIKTIFDYAENKNCILFFDEGDALFSKRTEQKNANDRNSNQEIAYLLQRIEIFNGIVFLCTNKLQNMDDAFKRRFHSRIEFTIPQNEQRFKLWKKYITSINIELEDKTYRKLAEIPVSGAVIKNFCKWYYIIEYTDKKKSFHLDKFHNHVTQYFIRHENIIVKL